MDYGEFSAASREYLPLNRKERFYTATVLPSLLFHRGVANFYAFLHLIQDFPENVNEQETRDSFLCYTEYNLKQAAGNRNVGLRLDIESNDTPDLLILALRPELALIALEGKMFADTSQSCLDQQMRRQAEIVLQPLAGAYKLPADRVFHAALVPEKLALVGNDKYQVLNWEVFFRPGLFDLSGNHFTNYLRFALEHYRHLVSLASRTPSTAEGQWTGEQIVSAVCKGDSVWVGRNGGEQAVLEDARLGRWRTRLYWVNSINPADGRPGNWIAGQRFFELTEQAHITRTNASQRALCSSLDQCRKPVS